MKESSVTQSIVFVVDDDGSIREAIKSLFESVGLQVALFGSATAFLESQLPDIPCLVLDVRSRVDAPVLFGCIHP
jgi:FixJ family two-component response regulator